MNKFICNEDNDANTIWTESANCIERIGKVVFGKTQGSAPLSEEDGGGMKMFILLFNNAI